MLEERDKQVVERIDDELKKLNNKEFTCYFFTLDSKGTPSGTIAYVYEMALTLMKMGYNVKMLHNEKEFVGVGDWLGDEYAELPHANVDTDNIAVSPSDFLFIPEVLAQLMSLTKNLPCKRIAIMQNFDFLTEYTPLGSQWANFGISDAIVSNGKQDELLKEVFPYMSTRVLLPKIQPYFRKGVEPKKLIVNIISKKATDANKIIKPFYWKFPVFKWVSFRDLRGFPKEKFAELLREGAITVWVDDETPFGYSPLEAMKSGSVVIGKIPDVVPEWMEGVGDTLRSNGIWFEDIHDVHSILYGVIKAWVRDQMPSKIYDEMEKTVEPFSPQHYEENLKKVIAWVVGERINEFKAFKKSVENNNLKKGKEGKA